MSKFDWEKENIKKNNTKNKTAVERWKEVKDAFVKATKDQKRLIRQYDMFPHGFVNRLSKKAASDIIDRYTREHGLEKINENKKQLDS